MAENMETEIRKALDAAAHEVDVPEGLSERTLAMAREEETASLRGRIRAWRDSRRVHARVTGYPRVLYAAGAAATAVLLFVIGAIAIQPPRQEQLTTRATEREASRDVPTETVNRAAQAPEPVIEAPAEESSGASASGDAVAGQIAGTLSSGDASVDQVRGNTSLDADGESGDADFSSRQAVDVETGDAASGEDPASFAGLTAGPPGTAQRFLDPQLVKSADIRVAVRDFDPAWDHANDVAARYGGAVVASRTQLVEDRIAQGTVTMRVPSVKLDQVIDDLRGLGTLAQLTTSGDDIAQQIDDVKEKVKDAKTEQTELLTTQQRARTAAEQAEIDRRLENLGKEIDSLKSKQKKYEDQVEFSAVSATIFEDESVQEDSTVLGRALRTGVGTSLTILAGTLVVTGGLLPLAVLGVVIWLIVRAARRKRAA